MDPFHSVLASHTGGARWRISSQFPLPRQSRHRGAQTWFSFSMALDFRNSSQLLWMFGIPTESESHSMDRLDGGHVSWAVRGSRSSGGAN